MALKAVALKAVALAAVVVALAGCAGLPEAVAPPDQDRPVVTADQAHRIASATGEVVARVASPDVTWDPDLAATRLTGPAARWAAFTVPAGRSAPLGTLPGPVEQDVVVAPRAAPWPRAFAVVDSAVVRVYVSESARSPYRLWAAMPVLDPSAVPDFGPVDTGVPPAVANPSTDPSTDPSTGAADAGGTGADADAGAGRRSMAEVVGDLAPRYVDVLTAGDASAYAPEFEADGFAAGLRARVEAERTRLAGVASTEVTHQAAAEPPVVLAVLAANGDALVVAAFTTTMTSTVVPGGGSITVGEELAGPAGASAVDGRLVTQSVAALAFVVPATSGNIQVVAAAEAVTGVVATPG